MEKEPTNEQEQGKEEILRIITEAIEAGKKVMITQSKSDGRLIQNVAQPILLQGDILEIESNGFGLSIDINTIEKVEQSG